MMNVYAYYKEIYQQRKTLVQTSPAKASGSLPLQENATSMAYVCTYVWMLKEYHVSVTILALY